MTTQTTPHRWADVLRAIADGEEVHYRHGSELSWLPWRGEGDDKFSPLSCESYVQWRIAPKKQTVWVNVYVDMQEIGWHASKEDANRESGSGRIACVPLTFTEGEGLE